MHTQLRMIMVVLALTTSLTAGGLWQADQGLNRLLGSGGNGDQLAQVIPAVRDSGERTLVYGQEAWRLMLEMLVPRGRVVIERVRQKWSDVTELAAGGREEADPR